MRKLFYYTLSLGLLLLLFTVKVEAQENYFRVKKMPNGLGLTHLPVFENTGQVVAPQPGMMIYDRANKRVVFYAQYAWVDLCDSKIDLDPLENEFRVIGGIPNFFIASTPPDSPSVGAAYFDLEDKKVMYYVNSTTGWKSLDELDDNLLSGGLTTYPQVGFDVSSKGTFTMTFSSERFSKEQGAEEGAILIDRNTGIAYIFDGIEWSEVSCIFDCAPIAHTCLHGDHTMSVNDDTNGNMVGEFSYRDAKITDPDPADCGMSLVVLRWYLSKAADYSDKEMMKETTLFPSSTNLEIEAATSYKFTLQMLLDGYKLGFAVLPLATEAAVYGDESITWILMENAAPVVDALTVTGDITGHTDEIIKPDFTMSDKEKNMITSPDFSWYRADAADGANSILCGEEENYTIKEGEWGKFFTCKIVPHASYGRPDGEHKVAPWIQAVNSGPFASVRMSGDFNCSSDGKLIGEYAMRDNEDNPYSLQSIKWYRNTTATTAGALVISEGTTNLTYTLLEEDLNKYIGYSVTGIATVGRRQGNEHIIWKQTTNNPPVITTPTVAITENSGSTEAVVTHDYDWTDTEGNPHGTDEISWEMAEDENGANANSFPISGTYTFSEDDYNKFMKVTVTPKATQGILAGTTKSSEWTQVKNCAPVTTHVGINVNGNEFSAYYAIVDAEHNALGEPSFQWYNNGAVIDGAITDSYTVTPDAGLVQEISVGVTPTALFGLKTGNEEKGSMILNHAPEIEVPSVDIIENSGSTEAIVSFIKNYSDGDGDLEGDSEISWVMADDDAGTNQKIVSTSDTYTFVEDDYNKFMQVTLIPKALTGVLVGTPTSSVWTLVSNAAPVITNTTLSIKDNSAANDAVVNFIKDWSDADGNSEGENVKNWEIADDDAGTNKKSVATSDTYTFVNDDYNKYVRVTLTPKALAGVLVGANNSSDWNLVKNCAPVVTHVGINVNGNELSAYYAIVDAEQNDLGDPVFQWYKNDVIIPGANTDSYTASDDDLNHKISVGLTPKANYGLKTGDESIASVRVNHVPEFTAPEVIIENNTGAEEAAVTHNSTWSDFEGDSQGDNVIVWERADDESGLNSETLPFSEIYTISNDDYNKFMRVTLTPIASTGALVGTTQISDWTKISNDPPMYTTPEVITENNTGADEASVSHNSGWSDADGNSEGINEISWVMADDDAGTNQKNVSTSETYTFVEDDYNKFMQVTLTPKALAGVLVGTPKISDWTKVSNAAPVITNTTLSIKDNSVASDAVVNFIKDWSDADGNSEGENVKNWEIADDDAGTNKKSVATSDTYTFVNDDYNKYVRVTLTPKALAGVLVGANNSSDWNLVKNCAPVVTHVGINVNGNELSAYYAIVDAEQNDLGDPVFQWYKNDVIIPGANTDSYTASDDDLNHKISVGLTPKANYGLKTGDESIASVRVNHVPEFTAPEVIIENNTGAEEAAVTHNSTWSDFEGDSQGDNVIVWERADDESGLNSETLPFSEIYTISNDDYNKFMRVTLTPIASTGALVGTTQISDWTKISNDPPVYTTPEVITENNTGADEASVRHNSGWSDADGNSEGTNEISWVMADDDAGTNQKNVSTSETYTFVEDDYNKFMQVTVIPKALAGVLVGTPKISDWTQVSNVAPVYTTPAVITENNTGADEAIVRHNSGWSDADGNSEGTNEISWVMADDDAGTNPKIVSTSETYTFVNDDYNKFMQVTLIPKALAGVLVGTPKISDWTKVSNVAPVITNTTLSIKDNSAASDAVVNFIKDWSDADGNSEGENEKNWEIADDDAGTNKKSVATSDTYTFVNDDYNKYVRVTLTPKALAGVLVGANNSSDWNLVKNCAPIVTHVDINVNGNELSAIYAIVDAEQNPMGDPTFQWYKDDVVIPGANTDLYTATAADLHHKISVGVTPTALYGVKTGDESIASYVVK
jgi:hypothetical protein